MIASMTAYARTATQQPWGQAIWELRSINHRYLDLSLKLPDNFREWEIEWRNMVSNTLFRGKVECHLTFMSSSQTAPLLNVNAALLEQLLASYKTVLQYPGISPTINAMELLRWPEVLRTAERELSFLKEPLTALLRAALEELVQMRYREGNALAELLRARLGQVSQQITIAKERLPLSLQAQKQKIEQKIAEMKINVDPQRLEQELVFYAQRMDVEEEVERLATHVKEVERTLEGKGAMGRRLDFLMQELNREANTLAAKSVDPQVTGAALELKVLIEQMREQIQNVE